MSGVINLAIPCSADRNRTDFMVKEWRHDFQKLGILRGLCRSQHRLYRLLLFLLPYELPAGDLHRRRRGYQGAVSNCCQHDGVGVVVRQSSLAKFL